VETRGGNKKPQLSDLRESGAIEQDADIVSFIYRPEYYQLEEFEDGMPTKGMAEIIIAKHRNGGVGDVRLRFQGEFSRFADPVEGDFTGGDPNVITISSRMNDDFIPDPTELITPKEEVNKQIPTNWEYSMSPTARMGDDFSPF
jgi:replicative DNA helicase